jgi:hypothetical protein
LWLSEEDLLKITQKQKWEAGKQNELTFWRACFETQGLQWPEEFRSRLDPGAAFPEYLIKLVPISQTDISILDVGAGPLTSLGTILKGHNVHLTAIDPLAPENDKLLNEFSIKPPTRTVFGEVEHLERNFGPNSFDIVHMRNALDHSYHPVKGILKMINVVKMDHCVVINHSANEAEKEDYQGFHQWNLDIIDGQFVIWNKRQYYNMNRILKKLGEVAVDVKGGWLLVTITKRKPAVDPDSWFQFARLTLGSIFCKLLHLKLRPASKQA